MIGQFLLGVYAPIGAAYSIYIWTRPLEQMMVYVALTPLLLLLAIWAIVVIGSIFTNTGFAFATISIAVIWGVFASIFCVAIGFVHVLISHGIYTEFRDSGWFELDQD